jgi:hypothetical protein
MSSIDVTETQTNAIYDLLIQYGAPSHEYDRMGFLAHWPACREYRFCGVFGFGGKVWANCGEVYVSYYQEDKTPEREAALQKLNESLRAIMENA